MSNSDFYKKYKRENTKAIVIINEQHKLLDEQKKILEEKYEVYEVLQVPAQGWTLQEMDEIIDRLTSKEVRGNKRLLDIVFVSPIPYLLVQLTRKEVDWMPEYAEETGIKVKVFHNDNRIKKELPNGKIIQTVAETGWQLL